MGEIDKIVEIFQSGQYQLAIQLANGIGMSDMELLMYIWENDSEYYDEDFTGQDYCEIQRCGFGEFLISLDIFIRDRNGEFRLENNDGDDFYYSTLYNALDSLIRMITYE